MLLATQKLSVRTRIRGCSIPFHSKTRRYLHPTIEYSEIIDNYAKTTEMIRCFRDKGHFWANLDPIKSYEMTHLNKPTEAQKIDSIRRFLDTHSMLENTSQLLDPILGPTDPIYLGKGASINNRDMWTAKELALFLYDSYLSSVGVEYTHLEPEYVHWIQQKIEGIDNYGSKNWNLVNSSTEEGHAKHKKILEQLTKCVHIGEFFRTKYPRSKVFGIEGSESVLPGLYGLVEMLGMRGAEALYMGMSHRGRMNLLHNFLHKSLEVMCTTFSEVEPYLMHDVKFHAGARTHVEVTGDDGVTRKLRISLSANPSHLEIVNPVVLGKTKAIQFHLDDSSMKRAVPLLIHGDASFAAEGIVAETLELSQLPQYTVGGTIHVIINNQIGFTTPSEQGRSSVHCTNMAKVIQAPIFHVNGDDVMAVYAVCQLAAEFRQIFNKDAVVDIVCYRKYGHSSLEDPLISQPLLYHEIKQHPSVLELYSNSLVEKGIITREESAQLSAAVWQKYDEEYDKAGNHSAQPSEWLAANWQGFALGEMLASRSYNQTGVRKHVLMDVGKKLCEIPDDFKLHPEVKRLLDSRKKMLKTEKGITMAFAEQLALGALLKKFNPKQPIGKLFDYGTGHEHDNGMMSRGEVISPQNVREDNDHPIDEVYKKFVDNSNLPMELNAHPTIHVRLTGQDVVRGSFNQRHASIVCQETGKEHWPLDHLGENCASITICNSNLSEMAALGYEYGYSLGNELALVIWEAQFGDFGNMAQCIIDNFIASGESKWGNQSSLVMLLPHGYDGQGPEHSSGRMERFLQLVNEDDYAIPGNNYIIRKEMEIGFDAIVKSAHSNDDADHASDTPTHLHRRHFIDAVVDRVGPHGYSPMQLQEIFQEYCSSSDMISKEEWCNMMSSWLQSNAERNRNIIVAQPSTPAQLFHCLRRQIHRPFAKPLICMSPKFLFHHQSCTSDLEDFTTGTFFHRVITEGGKADNMRHRILVPHDEFSDEKAEYCSEIAAEISAAAASGVKRTGSGSTSKLILSSYEVKRVIFLTGKLFYPLFHARQAGALNTIAFVRVEQLSPFPYDLILSAILKYPNAQDLVWCQEEPKNMGAWSYIKPRFDTTLRENNIKYRSDIRYICIYMLIWIRDVS